MAYLGHIKDDPRTFWKVFKEYGASRKKHLFSGWDAHSNTLANYSSGYTAKVSYFVHIMQLHPFKRINFLNASGRSCVLFHLRGMYII